MRGPPAVPPSLAPALLELRVALSQDPRSAAIADAAISALNERRPLSVIRLGDGEFNLLCYRRYPGIPTIDQRAAHASFARMKDGFTPDAGWLVALREMMFAAIADSDIIGILGVEPKPVDDEVAWLDRQLADIRESVRFRAGSLRGRRAIIEFARDGLLAGKMVTSWHLYYGVINNLDRLLASARRTVLVTSRTAVAPGVSQRSPAPVDLIATGQNGKEGQHFLAAVEDQLPSDMSGMLALIGAGIWGETYCSWVKRRGGVAIDIGSGFDLLAGDPIRPHQLRLSQEERDKYRI